ncbi:protein kinase domain-containing protein [Psychrobium sp. nBUS_13]|uniref:protein kinase domain-containing protein n=1 Tax=Psychrobium sp. nBUS_13 TaxID=3395319 RepID=UPI003EB8BBB4
MTDTTTAIETKKTHSILSLKFGGISEAGAKPENQDAFAALQPAPSVREHKGNVVCIADGVSCSDDAKQASQLSVTTFLNDYYSTPDAWAVKDCAARVLSSLNSWLYHHGKQASYKQNRMVTTFSGAVFKSNTAYLFHVGDSRIYLFRNGKLRQLTKDHCQFTSKDSSFLIRALGMDNHLQVDFHHFELNVGDRFLFSTDGIHEFLTATQLTDVLSREKEGLEALAKELCAQALAAGSTDNLTAFIAEIESLPRRDLNEVSRELTAFKVPPILRPGAKIDDFKIEKVVHVGTRSHVYVAKHAVSQCEFVLKMPSENFSDDLPYLEGFAREQWIGSRINSQRIMRIFPRSEFQEHSPFLYHVCEYVRGRTLRQWMYDNPSPSFTQVRLVSTEIVAAVRVMQRLSMVHRDLKPENIMITDSNKVKLIDFATVQVAGLEEIISPIEGEQLAGAVGYIAPEYLMGHKGVHRSDIFSVGVIVYEMLTGRLPYKPDLLQKQHIKSASHWRYIRANTVDKTIPVWMDLALKKATEPNIFNRYQAMSEFVQDLKIPNRSMLSKLQSAPLLERNPLAFWKMLSGVLAILLIAQYIMCFA